MTHSSWWLIVDALCVYRLAVLLVYDTITLPFRDWVIDWRDARWQRYAKTLITCPWCVSVWIAAAVVALTATAPEYWQYPAAVFAFSAVAGFLAERTDH